LLPVSQEIAARWRPGHRTYRVGVIGCGRIARTHAAALTQHPAVELAAVCDVLPDAVGEFGRAFGVPADGQFAEYQELLERISLDAVHVCTWPDTHAAITMAAARRGIHVYCEKPIALDLGEADAMIVACKEAGVVLGVNHHRRGDSRFRRAKRLIEDGAIGDLRLLKGDHGGGGRRLMSMSTHLYDLFRFLAGDVGWVSGQVFANGRAATVNDVETIPHEGLAAGDEVTAQFQFRSGAYGYHDGLGHVDVEICGTHGRMVFYEGAARKPWPFGEVRAAWARYPAGDAGRSAPNGGHGWTPLDGVPAEELENTRHAYARCIDRFYRAVDGERGEGNDGAPLCTGEDGRASIEVALALYESHFTNQRTALPMGYEHPLATYAPAPAP
jgi:predicted dehydrogenase